MNGILVIEKCYNAFLPAFLALSILKPNQFIIACTRYADCWPIFCRAFNNTFPLPPSTIDDGKGVLLTKKNGRTDPPPP